MATAIQGEVLRRLLPEFLQLARVVAVNPAGGVNTHRLVAGFHLVLVFKAVRHHVKLELAHRPHHQVTAVDRGKHLGGTLLGQLLQALLQLLGLHRISQANAAKQLRGEVRDAGELQILALGERIAYLDSAVVVQADDVARHRLLHQLPLAGLERHRVGDFHVLAQAHVAHFHALAVAP